MAAQDAAEWRDLVDLEDAVVVIRDQSGKIQLGHSVDLAGAQASAGLIAGTFLGGLIGMLFLNPTAGFLLGGMFGASAGALSGSLADYGIDDDSLESLAETIPNNSSALFVLARKARQDKVTGCALGRRRQGPENLAGARSGEEVAGGVGRISKTSRNDRYMTFPVVFEAVIESPRKTGY